LKLGTRSIVYSRNYTWQETPGIINNAGFAGVQIGLLYKGLEELGTTPRIDPALFPKELLHPVRDAYLNAGLEIWCMDCYNDLSGADDQVRGQAIERMKAGVRVCKDFGCQAIVTEPGGRGIDSFERCLESLQEIMPVAEAEGSFVCIEPSYVQSVPNSYAMAGLIEAVGSPNLKVLLDAANILVYDSVDRMFEVLGEHILFCHTKDCIVDEKGNPTFPSAGEGMMNHHRFIELVLEHGCPPLIIEYAWEHNIEQVRDFLFGVIAEVEGNT